jgi:hypothetical protein
MILKIEEILNYQLIQKIKREQDLSLKIKNMIFKNFKEVKVFRLILFKILIKHREQK